MAKSFNVSQNIGYDGYTYFCRRCGKAGYERATQVRGHLALCPGTLLRKGMPATSKAVLPTSGYNHLQVVNGAVNGGLGGVQQPLEEVVVGPVDNQLAARFVKLEGQVAQLQNEYHHVLGERNLPASASSWLSQNMGVVVIGILILFVVLSANRGSCQDGTSQRRGPDLNKLTDRVLSKAADTVVTKGLGRIFR